MSNTATLESATTLNDDFIKFFIKEFDKLSLKIKDKASEKRYSI